MFIVQSIRTPTDFKRTMDCEDYVLHEWVTPPAEVEPDVRHTLDEIFSEDLQAVGGEADLTRYYLDSIRDPLQALQAMGLQLVSVLTSGKLTLPAATFEIEEEKTMPWRRVHYIVATEPAYYRRASTSSAWTAKASGSSGRRRVKPSPSTVRSKPSSATSRAPYLGASAAVSKRSPMASPDRYH